MIPQKPPIDWLLKSSPWVEYRTRRDLLESSEDDPDVISSRKAMLDSPLVQELVDELSNWPGGLLNSHKSAGHALHKLTFLADLGLRQGDPGIERIIEQIFSHQSAQGPFQMLSRISPEYGGSGKEEYAWVLCDAPLVVTALVKFGLGDDKRITAAVTHLISLARENGWPCAVSPELGKWRGPGKKDDPCPYANLIMVKLLAEMPRYSNSRELRIGSETALSLWNDSQDRHPYMFYMGTDFRKLKAPLVWYDIMNLIDTLSKIEFIKGDSRLHEMVDLVAGKMNEEGRLTPESIWKAWSEWDFGQKKVPSPWLTMLAWRAIKRLE